MLGGAGSSLSPVARIHELEILFDQVHDLVLLEDLNSELAAPFTNFRAG